ncbi:DNA/RNA helicases, SNF2 family [hydrothermal vent metagenome]|uniref:DNA/RNA helicases, SNF2 family n=1 Tax=hydrothermal vent metagenome TaxID=652676 RepID=A0A3B0W7R9_9ZZZZ
MKKSIYTNEKSGLRCVWKNLTITGQDKAVFVYKLIVENTIEEKIIALQAKKQKLQDGIYQTQENQQEQKFSGAELINLLQE